MDDYSLPRLCPFCSTEHPPRDQCPEHIAAAQATVQKHTLGTRAPVTLQQLEETHRVIESLMKNSRWVLVSPNGEMWAERDPKMLINVLLTKIRT